MRPSLSLLIVVSLCFAVPVCAQSTSVPLIEQVDHRVADELDLLVLPALEEIEPLEVADAEDSAPQVQHSFAQLDPNATGAVQTIPIHIHNNASNRLVRYDVPLSDTEMQRTFALRGIEGRLIEVPEANQENDSAEDRLKGFFNPMAAREKKSMVKVVRFEVPAEDISFHSQMASMQGEILEPTMLRLPEVRFFQPKARIFADLKRDNDAEFDLFSDGAILASLDVIELYFPMPLVSDRFAEAFGKSSQLSSIGWRVGGTIGLGISTALTNGDNENGSAPVSTMSSGIRYEFPLGRPSREVLETGDPRLDQRTRVGIEGGIQAGVSTKESLQDRTDVGFYFGILVNTPWGG